MIEETEANKAKIEAIFRRRLGPSPEQKALIKALDKEPVWRVKCRNCGHYNEGVRLNAMPDCEKCGVPLGNRPNP